jgi:hypothetical protein
MAVAVLALTDCRCGAAEVFDGLRAAPVPVAFGIRPYKNHIPIYLWEQ